MEEIKGQYDPKKLEARILKLWEEKRIPQRVIAPKPTRPKFYLLDGPPYVNQIPHVGHVKTTTAKDIWSKFKLMQGFDVWLQPGFDCHGLPIEVMVEQELGISGKKEIEEMGIDKFCKTCRKHAEDKKDEWLRFYRLLGAWRGWVDPYLTYKNYYIESAWWTVERLFEKGMLVQGERPIFWCVRCQTSLAGIEVTDAYAQVRDPSIYVKFPIVGKEDEFIVVWTTTPWTLISNVAIAVHPDEYYVRTRVGKETLILAEKRVDAVLRDECGIDYTIEEKFLGKELETVKYEPVLDVPIQSKLKTMPNAHQIVLSIPVKVKEEFEDFVTMEEGSGCVHCAPGHGPQDHVVGQHYNLPTVSPVDVEGKFTSEAGRFAGSFVKDADKQIIEELEKRGALLHFGWVTHSYPLCWRCKTPLIYRLSRQWFFKIDTIKEKMLSENEKVRWLPEWAGEKFRHWLREAVDWCVSRQRYWGIPLPVWTCERCGTHEVIGSIEELRKRAKRKLPKDVELHRHVVDRIEVSCRNCGSTMKRVADTMDVWFDSGVAPWASLAYPAKPTFERLWPMDLICEAEDQIRGWFYSLMFCGIATFDRVPYSTVCMIGHVLDEKGRKMSKSLGNVVWSWDALKELGADVLRLYYCWEVAPWENQKFSFRTAEEVRRALNILWNCYAFFTTYCDAGFKPSLRDLKVEDRWILSRLQSLIMDVTRCLENFELHRAGRSLMNFVMEELSRFYIRLIRDRTWVSARGKDKQAALSTLYEVLVTLSKLLAPLTPFLAEEMYQNLSAKKASVHLDSWPIPNKKLLDKTLEEHMNIVRQVVDANYSARAIAKLRLRWPLPRLIIVTKDKTVPKALKTLNKVLLKACNVKDVKVSQKGIKGEFIKVKTKWGQVWLDVKVTPKLWDEALVNELIRKVQQLRKERGYHVRDLIELRLASDVKTNRLLKKNMKRISKEVGAKHILIGLLKEKPKEELRFKGKSIGIEFIKV